MTTPDELHAGSVYAAALRGEPCLAHGMGSVPRILPLACWSNPADATDRVLLARCTGATLDIDFVLAPLVVIVGYVVVRLLPIWALAPFAAAALVLGSGTLAVLPTLGRFGAKPDDPYLLNRSYLAWWVVLAAMLLLAAAGWALYARRSAGRRTEES